MRNIRAAKRMPASTALITLSTFELPIEDAEDFAIFMLKEFSYNGSTLMFAPAEDFYVTKGLGRNQVRLAYVLCKDELEIAATCLEKGLEAYKGRKHSSEHV